MNEYMCRYKYIEKNVYINKSMCMSICKVTRITLDFYMGKP